VLLEANDEWQLQHCYIQVKAMAELDTPPTDNSTLISTTEAA
jgi:putative transposase